MRITENFTIGEEHIKETFIRSSGPGGQNVNKSATAVQLRFDVRGCTELPVEVKLRLLKLAASKATVEGHIVITAREFRSQDQNREEARARLRELITAALTRPTKRKKTRPSRSSVERRISSKKKRSETKAGRGGSNTW